MSGIFGIWHRDGRPVDPIELARLCATLGHRGRHAEALRIDGDAGLACCLSRISPESRDETQPVADDLGVTLVFDGRLDDRAELIASIGRISNDAADSVVALAAYRAFGDGFAARLSGDFALALYDPRRRQMLLARDAVGVRPLYYFASPRLFLFASEIKALVSHPAVEPRPDDDALADFLFTRCAGQEPTERTLFEDIVAVLPSHVVVVEPQRVRTKRYWDFDPTRRIRFARETEYGDAFKEHFDRAVRRRLRSAGPVAVSVSGGLDSSAVFCAADAIARETGGAAPIGVSLTYPEGSPQDEGRFLVEIERACGLSIDRVYDPAIGFSEDAADAVWHAEAPLVDYQWNATHAHRLAVRDRRAAVLLTGDWGDQFLFDDSYLVDLWRSGSWWTAWRHLATFGRWIDVPQREFVRRFGSGLLKYHVPDAMISGLRRLRAGLRPRPAAWSWYTDTFVGRTRPFPRPKRTRAAAHARAMYGEVRSQYALTRIEWHNKIAALCGVDIAFPFLDRDLIAYLMAIPGDEQTRNGVPKALLRDAYAAVMPDAIVRRSTKADFTERVNAGAAREHATVVDALRNGLAVERQYVRRDAVDAIAASEPDAGASSAVDGWALADLFALEMWLREFIGPERRCQKPRRFEDARAV